MHLRSFRERIIQTLGFELGGLVVATPLYMAVSGASLAEGTVLTVVLAVIVAIWSPLHNTVFDIAEWRLARRVASDRPQAWRVVHAITHEVTSLAVTLPAILWLTDYGIVAALLLDLGLSAVYVLYAWAFHIVYDRLRPVRLPATGAA